MIFPWQKEHLYKVMLHDPGRPPNDVRQNGRASTRTQIIESAIKCLVELGYARTTTAVIADKAGLSRGAMLHHFPSKMDIVRAAVDHLHAKRLRAMRKSMAKEPIDGDHVKLGVQSYWAHVKHPWFVAFFELAVAARTDNDGIGAAW